GGPPPGGYRGLLRRPVRRQPGLGVEDGVHLGRGLRPPVALADHEPERVRRLSPAGRPPPAACRSGARAHAQPWFIPRPDRAEGGSAKRLVRSGGRPPPP